MTASVFVGALFLAAAAIGTTIRVLAAAVDADRFRVPIGTLAVNVGGAFLLGIVSTWPGSLATVVGAGGLGAMTTFSTFAGELVELRARDRAAWAGYLVLSVAGGIVAASLGRAVF